MIHIKECIGALISLEPVFARAGERALELQGKAAISKKLDTGIAGVDIVTEADFEVQEMILQAAVQTPLRDCILIAEENTPTVRKFTGTYGLRFTLDPIDGTAFYAVGKGVFSVIVYLHDGTRPLYTYFNCPNFQWTRRILDDEVTDFGTLPKIPLITKDNLSKTIIYTYGNCNPRETAPKMYVELTAKGYSFRNRKEVVGEESGSTVLFLTNETVGGFYTEDPLVYDAMTVFHFGLACKLQMYSTVDMSHILKRSHGPYYPGWYVVLRKL